MCHLSDILREEEEEEEARTRLTPFCSLDISKSAFLREACFHNTGSVHTNLCETFASILDSPRVSAALSSNYVSGGFGAVRFQPGFEKEGGGRV
jgi:hypothetical protein